jgi:hypothetical protein
MTIVDEPTSAAEPQPEGFDLDAAPDAPDASGADATTLPPEVPTPATDDDDARPFAELARPILAAALATSAAGLVAGGIFGSWPARLTGMVGAFAGAGWALLALRSKRTTLIQGAFPAALVLLAAIAVVTRGETPSSLPSLVGDAISAGRLFRPPVPFDPGWSAILLVVFALIGFAAAWVGTALDRPKLGVMIPLPVVGLTAITQPDNGELIAGICAFLPILAALAVLFGGDTRRAAELDRQFELKRALRGGLAAVPLVGLLIAFNSASFLFPKPVYNPDEQPQKPRAVPLSAAADRVLFEVATTPEITGPWRVGVLDVYDPDDGFWKTPPRELERLPSSLDLDAPRADTKQLSATITVRDLGNTSSFPTVGGATRFVFPGGLPGPARFDQRTGLLRMESGRVPAGIAYDVLFPAYATNEQLAASKLPPADEFSDQLDIPKPPNVVQALLDAAPPGAWPRLDFLRQKLLANISAAGAGTPAAVTPEQVGEMFTKGAEATPYEIVAAEAMLARWAHVPARLGFGFDGLNVEGKVLTVRPRNSAQWLEVNFEGYGWLPLIGAPKKAKSTLDTDPNARFNPTIEPSGDVAVEIYLPFELQDIRLLFERIRDVLLRWLPVAAGALFLYLAWPLMAKTYRRSKRRRWAAALGPRAQIAVEYAEFRDLATDLNVADIYSTPLEYLYEVRDDPEHAEFAWLVARALYGDLSRTVTETHAAAAELMGTSLRRRLMRGQPAQSQLLAYMSRASLGLPYSTEVPNVRQLTIPRPRMPRLRLARARRARRLAGAAT